MPSTKRKRQDVVDTRSNDQKVSSDKSLRSRSESTATSRLKKPVKAGANGSSKSLKREGDGGSDDATEHIDDDDDDDEIKVEKKGSDSNSEYESAAYKSESDSEASHDFKVQKGAKKRKKSSSVVEKGESGVKNEPKSDSEEELKHKSRSTDKSKTTKSQSKSKTESTTSPLHPPNPPLPTPSLQSPSLNYSYEIARGEMGVLTFEPYKSLVLPYWRFRTVPIAQNSSETLWSIFQSFVRRSDFVGADMSRKFIQMGMTRAKRYANHKGGRKYDVTTGKELDKWKDTEREDVEGKRREKEMASEVFKKVWRRCIEDEGYLELKRTWMAGKKEYVKNHGKTRQ